MTRHPWLVLELDKNMFIVIFFLAAILGWYFYRVKMAMDLLNQWLDHYHFSLVEKKYHFNYRIPNHNYDPRRQLLYEIKVKDSQGKDIDFFILFGNYFWGMIKDEVTVVWSSEEGW